MLSQHNSQTDAGSCKGSIPKELCEQIDTAEARLTRLQSEIVSSEHIVEIQSFGLYHPRYSFENSSEYSARLKDIRAEQAKMLKEQTAAICPKNWMVDGSLSKGRKMLQEHAKLVLRAFNGECDAAVSKVKFSNVDRINKQIQKSFTSLNKLSAAKKIVIADRYLELKLSELYLVYEHRQAAEEEKETQLEIRRQMNEEQRALKEIEKAQKDAAKDESKYEKALAKARAELEESTGRQHDKLEGLVSKLQNELSAAIDRKVKSIARAQLTRSGHVYILSNIGSFGEGFYKIGMTRRLEPLDRVYELGDASVPFRFDVHAMIYTEDAPNLEAALHQEFEDRRVNKINRRREYFRVSLEEIAEAVGRLHGTITYVTVPEAKEYRQTIAMTE